MRRYFLHTMSDIVERTMTIHTPCWVHCRPQSTLLQFFLELEKSHPAIQGILRTTRTNNDGEQGTCDFSATSVMGMMEFFFRMKLTDKAISGDEFPVILRGPATEVDGILEETRLALQKTANAWH